MFLHNFWYFDTSVTYMDRIRISSWHSRTTEKITPQTNSVFLPPHLFPQSTPLISETDKQNWVFVRFYFLIRLFLVPGVSIATTDLFLYLPLNSTIASSAPRHPEIVLGYFGSVEKKQENHFWKSLRMMCYICDICDKVKTSVLK